MNGGASAFDVHPAAATASDCGTVIFMDRLAPPLLDVDDALRVTPADGEAVGRASPLGAAAGAAAADELPSTSNVNVAPATADAALVRLSEVFLE